MIFTSLLPFLPSLMAGFFIVCLLWPGPASRGLFIKLFLAPGIGIGLTSVFYFFWCLLIDPRSPAWWLVEALFLVIPLVLFYRSRKWRRLFPALEQVKISRAALVLSLFLTAALYYAVDSFISLSFMLPHGIQDAWGIWNMRARFMFRAGEDWLTVFSPLLYWLHHTDYPYFVTASVARAWSLLGSETFRVPLVLAGIFTFSTAGLLLSVLSSSRSPGQGIVASVVLLSTPWFLSYGSWQISDVPFSYVMLATAALMYFDRLHPHPGLQFLLGLFSGFAAWTKNEGVPFTLIISLVFLVFLWWNHRSRLSRLLPQSLPFLFGMLIPGSAVIVLKFFLAPPNDLFADQSLPMLIQSLLTPDRLGLTLDYLWRTLAGFGRLPAPLLLLLPAYLILMFRRDFLPPEKVALLGTTLATLSMAFVYLLIYLITPHDLEWHLKTSTNRLVYHFFPTLLWILFAAALTPEEMVNQLWQPHTPENHGSDNIT